MSPSGEWLPGYQPGMYVNQTYPAYYTNTSTTTAQLWNGQQYYSIPPGSTLQFTGPARDISFDPNPAQPAVPETEMEWLRRQNDEICALGSL